MLPFLLRPRLFLSYSRVDSVLADALEQLLEAGGCTVWMDRREVLVGDDFVRDLTQQLGRQDGLVYLQTATSAQSSWCHAEVQYALARRLPVFVVRRDPLSRLPDALERLLRDIQNVLWEGPMPDLGQQLQRVRRRRSHRVTVRAGIIVSSFAALLAISWLASDRTNAVEEKRRVASTVAGLARATTMLSGDEIRSRIQPLRAVPELAAALYSVTEDPGYAVTARSNAWQALDALQEGRQTQWRTFVPQVDWNEGRLLNTLWANTSYAAGKINNLQARHIRMAGLVFGAGPGADQPINGGLSLAGVRIRDADIWFLRFDATQLIDVEFLNSKFRGAQMDLSAAAGLRFVSRSNDTNFVTSEVSIIEDSWVVQHRALPERGVLDLAKPEQEIIFDGVQFVRVRFEGQFKPEWFRNSNFTDCVFATSITANSLTQHGNVESGSMFLPR